MPGRSGLDILRQLNAQNFPSPILVISGKGDIPMAVDAIKHGALDFIEKPFDADTVVTRVREAVEAFTRRQRDGSSDVLAQPFPGRDLLTAREREVLARIAGGASNKEAGRDLGISPRTIEVHRAHHGEARRQERRRPGAHRPQGRPLPLSLPSPLTPLRA